MFSVLYTGPMSRPALTNSIALDTETGGLSPWEASCVEVGVCSLGDDPQPASWLVNEGRHLQVSERSVQVHGLTVETLRAEGLSPGRVAAELEDYLNAHRSRTGWVTVWCHSVAFDHGFVSRLFRLAGLPLPERCVWRCSLSLLALAPPGVPQSLPRLAARYGVDTGTSHRALDDALTLRAVLPHLCAEVLAGRHISTSQPELF